MAKKHEFTRSGAERTDLEGAFAGRLLDAEALFDAGRFASAIVSGIYALEIRLKIRICDHLDRDTFPISFQFHELDGLLVLTGLERRLTKGEGKKSIENQNWEEICKEAEKLTGYRYSPENEVTAEQARGFLDRLKDPNHGVLTWLSKQ